MCKGWLVHQVQIALQCVSLEAGARIEGSGEVVGIGLRVRFMIALHLQVLCASY